MTELLRDVRASIFLGELDLHLDLLQETINKRREELDRQMFNQLVPGSLVRFNDRANPKYMIGVPATVVERKKKNVVIQLGRDIGRFSKGAQITTPIEIIDLIEPPTMEKE